MIGGSVGGSCSGGSSGKKPMSSIEALMLEEKERKERAQARAEAEAQEAEARKVKGTVRHDDWIVEGIVVKVRNKKLAGGEYHNKKGTIERVVSTYTAHVRIAATGDLIKVDQDDLETVIPSVGGAVLIVNGQGRGERGTLLELDESNFCVRVELRSGRVIDAVEYEDVCKLAL